MIKLIIIILLGAFCVVIVRLSRPEYAFLTRLAVISAVSFSLISVFGVIYEKLSESVSSAGFDIGYITMMLKIAAVSIISEIAAGICRDCSENALAIAAETAGKAAVLGIVIPVIGEIVKLCLNLSGR